MKVPNCVVWSIIKSNNSFLVKRGNEEFTKDPLSLTNLHNSSQSGLTNDRTVSISVHKEAAKKTHRRVFDLTIKHGGHHSVQKKSGPVFAKQSVKKEVGRLAKVVNSLHGVTDKQRALLLKRVHKVHSGNTLHTKKSRAFKVAKK